MLYFIEVSCRRNTYVYRMATNDEIRLKLTVSKMNIHRSTKLETIAAQRIVRNLDSFLDPQYSETRNVMLLPIAQRNIVLRQWLMFSQFSEVKKRPFSYDDCVEIFKKRMKVFQSLVSCHTLEVDLAPLIADSNNNCLASGQLFKCLKLIGAKATNLKALILTDPDQNLEELNNKTLCNAIGKLQNLTTLYISETQIDYSNLKEMCKNLKSLTHLSTTIYFNPYFDESNEREIEELQQIFSNLIHFETFGKEEKFTLNCIQHLPKLQCADNLRCPLNAYMIEELLDRCPNQKFALTRVALTEPSIYNKEIHLKFPDVNDLKFPVQIEFHSRPLPKT
ncbi:Hypothetical predicted protein [Cloeon dipterum]|uniref:Uncharacterized protein n=2 Tax=Cloeon dipterum TaxID=197152 RepID=A0A8S1DZV3_9INSE|nr:Hypothetical predicted protein [Cloeon dipterum]